MYTRSGDNLQLTETHESNVFKRKQRGVLVARSRSCGITRCTQPQLWHGQVARNRGCGMYRLSGDNLQHTETQESNVFK